MEFKNYLFFSSFHCANFISSHYLFYFILFKFFTWMGRSPELWLPSASYCFFLLNNGSDLSPPSRHSPSLYLSVQIIHSTKLPPPNHSISLFAEPNTAISRTSQLAFSNFLPHLKLRAAISRLFAPTRRGRDLSLPRGLNRSVLR